MLLSFLGNLLAQEQSGFATKAEIENYYDGGNEAFITFFKDNLDYPKTSYEDQIEGLLLFSFTIHTKKNIDVTFYTKLDRLIEEEVEGTIISSLPNWQLPDDKAYTFYQPIVFSLLPYYPETLEGNIPELPAALPLKFLQLFVTIKSKRIPENLDITKTPEEEVTERMRTMYVRTLEAYSKAKAAGNNETAYALLNKIIRYNPLEKQFLFDRIALEKALQVNDYQAYDARLLKDFVEAYQPLSSYETSGPSLGSSPYISRANNSYEQVYEEIYKSGFRGFIGDLVTIFQLPAYQEIRRTEGVMLIDLKTDEHGLVMAKPLTYFDTPIQQKLQNALNFMSLNWKGMEEPFHRIQPIYFGQEEAISYSLAEILPDYAIQKDSLFLTPLEFSGMSVTTVYDINFTNVEADEARKKNSTAYQRYLEAKGLYDDLSAKGKSKKALRALNEMIYRNPFNTELIELRLSMDVKGKEPFEPYDLALLEVLKTMSKN